MSWLKRLFGQDKPKNTSTQNRNTGRASAQTPANNNRSSSTQTQTIPPERVGLNGEFDQSGLAKRVALAFDEDPQIPDTGTLWVAQTGTTVVLKGKASNQQLLNRMVQVARGVNGATSVDTSQVSIG